MRLTRKGERMDQKGMGQGLGAYLNAQTDEHSVSGLKTASKPDAIIFPAERGNPDALPFRWEPTP